MKAFAFFALTFCFSLSHVFADTDQAGYAELLSKVVQKDGVRWDLLGQPEKDKLNRFLAAISTEGAADAGTKQAQLAFWINSYNACVMKLILDHWPVQDVMKIKGFRDRLTCKVAGSDRTLVDIQSNVIRPLFTEPRTLFALWWGVKGGPRLANEPYTASNLEQMLTQQTKEAIEQKNFVDADAKTVSLSPLFDWFKSDFGSSDQAVLEFIRKNASKEKAKKVPRRLSDAKFLTFDWSLDSSSAS